MQHKNFELASIAPPEMSWSSYEHFLKQEIQKYLLQDADNEKVFQRFFEKHPCLLPGPFGLIGTSGHYPYAGTVITQPRLVGSSNRIPDFMWIASDSMTIYPVLIEIEAPSKQWFTKKGKPTDKFAQAQDQLTEWKTWFAKPEHESLFYSLFSVPSSFHSPRTLKPLYVLVYGRRSEFDTNPRLNEKRAQLARSDEFLMTYDRLSPQFEARNFLCSKVENRQYVAKSIPPTLELGPSLAPYHALIHSKEAAAERNRLLTKERKDFLKSRFAYWDNYAMQVSRGIANTGDRE
ncbi:Shedu immune nuclease family protein [Alicyclobacillus sp. SO9]|uniref:Shedu immune nuclease family protein n=1 Tax=Alicyclobacillus sp. SO9 TaxID=2665646 RepID=UPI0018E87E6B|nr:Shedu immune nuclease family protein [Alicyclobacillus sp. SO9]QQE78378.1 DUF4263 domain-containing protein [Alicyclobacillus sp. SO9]